MDIYTEEFINSMIDLYIENHNIYDNLRNREIIRETIDSYVENLKNKKNINDEDEYIDNFKLQTFANYSSHLSKEQ